MGLGKTTGIYGKSGIGKSSILRMIAGLDTPDKGSIQFKDLIWFDFDEKINILPSQRNIGFVFQDYNLFPNMTVIQNLEYVSDNAIPEYISSFITSSELNILLSSLPNQLSGGERQRISILRALSQSPDLLILDEPFSALDDDSILSMINLINQAKAQMKITVVIVSHRKEVLLKMADSVIHIESQIESTTGIPKDILEKSF
jgi:molybdate transport system ATP-binding protein